MIPRCVCGGNVSHSAVTGWLVCDSCETMTLTPPEQPRVRLVNIRPRVGTASRAYSAEWPVDDLEDPDSPEGGRVKSIDAWWERLRW